MTLLIRKRNRSRYFFFGGGGGVGVGMGLLLTSEGCKYSGKGVVTSGHKFLTLVLRSFYFRGVVTFGSVRHDNLSGLLKKAP